MEITTLANDTDRITFMDNLRYLMVLMVVVHHATISYCNFVPWWSVIDTSSRIMDILLIWQDIFMMPALFFIAGFFGVPSLQKHGARLFLKKKLKRMGLPLLCSSPLAGCLFAYIYYRTRSASFDDGSLWSLWRAYISSALEFHSGQLTAINQFSHSHLWFMSLLLVFFFMFAIVKIPKIKGSDILPKRSSAATGSEIMTVFVMVTLGSAFSMYAVHPMFATKANPEPWLMFANLIQFQPIKLAMYALWFAMGAFAYHRQWFRKTAFPGNPVVWAATSMVLFVALLFLIRHIMRDYSRGVLLLLLLVRSFCCLTILAACFTFAARRWNRPSRRDAVMAANSYYIYILHLIVVLLLQMLLAQWPGGPVLVKFGIVAIGAIFISYGLSRYLFRPYPVWAVGGVYFLFAVALITFRSTGA